MQAKVEALPQELEQWLVELAVAGGHDDQWLDDARGHWLARYEDWLQDMRLRGTGGWRKNYA